MQVDGFFYLHQFASEKNCCYCRRRRSRRVAGVRGRETGRGEGGGGGGGEGAEWEEGCCWVRDARQDECFDKDGESAPEV
jgi:hypothetical protein